MNFTVDCLNCDEYAADFQFRVYSEAFSKLTVGCYCELGFHHFLHVLPQIQHRTTGAIK